MGAMRRMGRIMGRSDDMMIIRGVNVFPTQIEELLFKCAGLAPHYYIELSRPNRMDEIKVCVEAKIDFIDEASIREQRQKLSGLIKELIGVTALVDVVMPGTIARSLGKVQRIRDLRQRNG
jgi:phenylacetate-CoA ligase